MSNIPTIVGFGHNRRKDNTDIIILELKATPEQKFIIVPAKYRKHEGSPDYIVYSQNNINLTIKANEEVIKDLNKQLENKKNIIVGEVQKEESLMQKSQRKYRESFK